MAVLCLSLNKLPHEIAEATQAETGFLLAALDWKAQEATK
jgi:hypothetical protein